MIYLIGGAPRSGKSMLAKQLSKSLGIPFYSTDDLEAEVRESTPREEWEAKFPKTVLRKKKDQSNDGMYAKFTIAQIVEAYIGQSRAVWEKIEALADSGDCIVEGYHIHPELVAKLEEKSGKENVRSVFLVRFDVRRIVDEATRFASKGDWFIEWTKDEQTYPKMAEMIKEFSDFFKIEAKEFELTVFNMDGQFESKLAEALAYLES